MNTNETNRINSEGNPMRRHHRREQGQDKTLKTRNILNIIFMLLAAIGVIIYLWLDNFTGTIVVLVAMAVKMIECIMRMLR